MEELRSSANVIITIITPSYNRATMIANAIESVLAQDFQAFEHIIVDGGSTDGTLEIIQRYPHLKLITGSDQSMYDALNKGLQIATGEIIGFLNTDDLYAENIFSAMARKFEDPHVMAVAGRAIVFSELSDGKVKIINEYSPADRSLIEDVTKAGAFFNAWFYRKATFSQIGEFNPNYKIAGDRDFMLRFALNHLKYVTLNELTYKYRMHEDSLTFDKNGEKRVQSANEHLTMLRFYLAKQDLAPSVRKLLIRAQTSETVDMAARSVWLKNYKKFADYSLRGFKHDPLWPFKFLQYILVRGTTLLMHTKWQRAGNDAL